MLYAKLIIFCLIPSLSYASKCPKSTADLTSDYAEREKYGIINDGTRTLSPKDCTPIMKNKKMIPLSKRRSAGVNRERFMDAECNVYEWDSQHGRFEKYKFSGTSNLTHVGEISPVYGVSFEDKADAKRNYTDTSTGIDGYNLKDLCKEHSRGMVKERTIQKSMYRDALICL